MGGCTAKVNVSCAAKGAKIYKIALPTKWMKSVETDGGIGGWHWNIIPDRIVESLQTVLRRYNPRAAEEIATRGRICIWANFIK